MQEPGELIRHFHIQLIILGKGEEKYNRLLREASRKYHGHLRLSTDFNEQLAHRFMPDAIFSLCLLITSLAAWAR